MYTALILILKYSMAIGLIILVFDALNRSEFRLIPSYTKKSQDV